MSLVGLIPGEYYIEVYGFDATNTYRLDFVTPLPPTPSFTLSIDQDSLVANTPRPTITGIIDDLTATIALSVGGKNYSVANPGTGTWAIQLPTEIIEGYYDVTALGTNKFGDQAVVTAILKVDFTAPIATFDNIPSRTRSPVSTLTASFSEAISEFVTRTSFEMSRDGMPLPLPDSALDFTGNGFDLQGLQDLTSVPGTYSLALIADGSGIKDLAGNLLEKNALIEWEMLPSIVSPPGSEVAFLLDGTTVSEMAVDANGFTYLVGSFSGVVDFDPRPDVASMRSTDDAESKGFLASYDASGALVQVTLRDYEIGFVSVADHRIAVGSSVIPSSETRSGRIELFDARNVQVLNSLYVVELTGESLATENASNSGVSLTRLFLNSEGQVFLAGTLASAKMTLPGTEQEPVVVDVPTNQADGFLAAFSASGQAMWAERLLAHNWIVDPVYVNSLSFERSTGVLVFGAALTAPLGILPGADAFPQTNDLAVAVGLDASNGDYRWHVPVVTGDLIDTVAIAATSNGLVYAAAHALIGAPTSQDVIAKAGVFRSALISIDAASGDVRSTQIVNELLPESGDVFVSGLASRPDDSVLLAVTQFGNGVSGSSRSQQISMLRFDTEPNQGTPESQVWSAPLTARTSQVQLSKDNRVVFRTPLEETATFPIGQDGDPILLDPLVPNSHVIWSIPDPFVQNVGDLVITVPDGITAVLPDPHAGDGAIVKRGLGTLVLDLANTHTGGLIVEEGEVIIRNVAALNNGPLVIQAGAKVSLDTGVSRVRVSALMMDPNGLLDVIRAGLVIAVGGYDPTVVRQLIIAGRNGGTWLGTTGISSTTAATTSGRAVGHGPGANGSLILGFAAPGDANMDNQVSAFDLVAVQSSGLFGTGTGGLWNLGDYNYDGVVNILDMVTVNSAGVYSKGDYNPTSVQGAASLDALPSATKVRGSSSALSVAQVAFALLAEDQNEPLPSNRSKAGLGFASLLSATR